MSVYITDEINVLKDQLAAERKRADGLEREMVRAVANVNDRALHYKDRAERLEAALREIVSADCAVRIENGGKRWCCWFQQIAHEALRPIFAAGSCPQCGRGVCVGCKPGSAIEPEAK